MALAIVAAEPVKVPDGGCVESVATARTHLRFGERRFAGVAGIKQPLGSGVTPDPTPGLRTRTWPYSAHSRHTARVPR